MADRYTVQVVDRSLDMLELLRDTRIPLSLQEISTGLGTAKSSSFRLLRTLERRGYVERVGDAGRYQLGSQWISYGGRLQAHRVLSEIALPHMERLRSRFGETVNLGVLWQGEIVYIEILESPRPFRLAEVVGSRSPIHSAALGKAIAAYLPLQRLDAIIRQRGLRPLTSRTITSRPAFQRELARVRGRGFAEDNGETEREARCIGAPIFGPDGRVMASMSISGPTGRIQAVRRDAARALVESCAAISRELGFVTTPIGSKPAVGGVSIATRGGVG